MTSRDNYNSKQRALIVVATFLNPDLTEVHRGGRPRLIRDFARELVRAGMKVLIVQKGARPALVEFERDITVRVVRAPLRMWADLLFALKIRRLTRDATLCCYGTPEDGFPFLSTNAVSIQHGVWWDDPSYSCAKSALVALCQGIRNLVMCHRVKAVICVDTNFPNYLRLFGKLSERALLKCHYLPNYVDLEKFPPPSKEQIQERFQRRHLLFVRRFEPARGPRLFLEACKWLRMRAIPFTAKMIGQGSGTREVMQLIDQYELTSVVKVISVPLDSVADAMRGGSLSIVPSRWSEGTSLAAIESLALGIPIVATTVGGLGNIVLPEHNGLMVPPDAQSIGRAILRLLEDPNLYYRTAVNCLSMRPAVSYERWAKQLREILSQCGALAEAERSRQASGGDGCQQG